MRQEGAERPLPGAPHAPHGAGGENSLARALPARRKITASPAGMRCELF